MNGRDLRARRLINQRVPFAYSYFDPVSDYANMRDSIKFPSGKGLIALRFDDNDLSYYTQAFAYMFPRSLPGTLNFVANGVGNYSSRTKMTIAQAKEMCSKGWELQCHSYTHKYLPEDKAGIQKEIIDAKFKIENDIGFNVRSFCAPGTWNDAGYPRPQLKTLLGKAILDNYTFYENYYTSTKVRRPNYIRFGANHVAFDNMTLAQMKAEVDKVSALNSSAVMILHMIGDESDRPAGCSIADFQAIIDYIVTKRDAGEIEVVTDSGLLSAGIGTPFNYATNGGIELLDTTGKPRDFGISGSPIVNTTSPRSGVNAIECNQSNYLSFQSYDWQGWFSPVFRASVWHKSKDGTTGTARLIVSHPDMAAFQKTDTSTTSWKKLEITFSVPAFKEPPDNLTTEAASPLTVYLQPTNSNWVIYDDFEITRIG